MQVLIVRVQVRVLSRRVQVRVHCFRVQVRVREICTCVLLEYEYQVLQLCSWYHCIPIYAIVKVWNSHVVHAS